jgi:subtilase family serine protease
MRARYLLLFLLVLTMLFAACSPFGSGDSPPPTATSTHQVTSQGDAITACPPPLNTVPGCHTPYTLRTAYDVETLTQQGDTGKGQTVIDIVSYGSPTLQQDMNVFDQQFHLPPITIQVVSPLGAVAYNPAGKDMSGWAGETTLDVEIIHAIAPDAKIIVMTSPVDETEGTIGLPQFQALEQYAVAHHLGSIFSQSYVASEATLADSKSRQFVQQYANFYQQITTQDGCTVLSGSGDNGATDWDNIAATQLAKTPTVNFPADVPWVTAVGGTSLLSSANGINESAWSGSGGGMSKFFSEPSFQQGLPGSKQQMLGGQRGIPDVSADADPNTGMAFYFNGQWTLTGGTSAATPTWAALVAIADQMAGHPLGNINPGLYKIGLSPNAQRDFRDITTGSNAVNTNGVQLQGFQAATGWDAVTGLGAPLASNLIPDLIAALK